MNPIPKLSASLILSRVSPSNNNIYELLFVKRPHNVNFPNCLAFPGGLLDPIDYTLCQNIHYKHIIKPQFYQNLLITALRETFEETGLFITKSQFSSMRDYKLITEIKQSMKENQNLNNYKYLINIMNQEIDLIKPIIRFATIQFNSYRNDTQFFYHHLTSSNFINYNQLPNNLYEDKNQYENYNNNQFIIINNSEIVKAEWLSIYDVLNQYEQKKVNLMLPQLLILNSLKHFQTHQQISQFLNNSSFLSTFPILLQKINSDNQNYKQMILLPWDQLYNNQLIIQNEQDSHFKTDFQKISFQKSKGRLYYNESINKKDGIIQNELEQQHLLKHLQF